MKIAVFNTKPYDRRFFDEANAPFQFALTFLEPRLTPQTSGLAQGYDAVCVFVNDQVDAKVLESLSRYGVRIVALRCAGFNNVAEHTAGLVLSLNRKIHRAYSRVREGNFSLNGLLGFDLHGRTVGIIGTGQIGAAFARIMAGFGCRLLGFDKFPNSSCRDLGLEYVDLPRLFMESDIISLHCPLTPETRYLINSDSIAQMKQGVMVVNTSRGAVIDTRAAIAGLKTGKIGFLGLDVYEEESHVFFEDLSNEVIPDDTLSRLLTFPNVVITGHQAFFTEEALRCIADTTLHNVADLQRQGSCANEVSLPERTGTR
jgi:D-lactate dehydrogenase